ncbi:MAG: methyl-accepting chemotaxis protein [Magnetococcus sp. DMHC-1]|nr:hypothetical protein [Magnetococcales bacterium]
MTKRMEANPNSSRLGLRYQVYGIVGTLLLLLLVNTFLGLGSGGKNSSRDMDVVRLLQDLNRGVGRLESLRLQQLLILEQAVSGSRESEQRVWFLGVVENVNKQTAALQTLLKKLRTLTTNPDVIRDNQRLAQHFVTVEKGLRDLSERGIQVLDRVQQKDLASGRKLLEEISQNHGIKSKDLEQSFVFLGSLVNLQVGSPPAGRDKIIWLTGLIVILALVMGVVAAWWIVSRHEREVPIHAAGGQMLPFRPEEVARKPQGRTTSMNGLTDRHRDLVQEIEAKLIHLSELGQPLQSLASDLAAHVQEMTHGAKKAIYDSREMRTNMSTINAWAEESNEHMRIISKSAEESSANMQSINKASEDANTALKMVAESSDQASVSMNSVRDAAERTNRNLNEVARSVEELNRSLMEVRKQCEAADKESGQASHNAQNNSEVMSNLAKAAQEIGKVIELINEIADQTNMLALNASIEAAGAGDAGKGFAVVANEVKELARQTTDAIRLVGDSVDEIQEKTAEATKAAHEMALNIERISQSNREILHTVDSQSNNIQAVAKSMEAVAMENSEVTRLVAESSGGISEMSRNVNEISEGIAEVTRNVTEATEGIHRMATGVGEIARGNIENSQNVGDAASSTTGVISSMEHVNATAEKIGEMGTGISTLAEGLNKSIHELHEVLNEMRS